MKSMKRTGFCIILFFCIFKTHAFGQAETLKVNYTLPDSAIAGIPFEVGLNLNRGNHEGIARIQLEWPLGFSVNEVENAGAIFSISKSQLQFLWVTLPKSQELNIRFEITANKEYSGLVEVPLVFIYLKNDTREEINLPSLKITIHGKGNRAFEKLKTTSKPAQTSAPVIQNKSIQEKQTEHASVAEKSSQLDKKNASTKEISSASKLDQVKKEEVKSAGSKSDSPSQKKSQTNKQTEVISPAKLEKNNKMNTDLDSKKNGLNNLSSSVVSVISFKIQLLALPQKSALNAIAKEFEITEKEITEEKHNGLFKYTYGEFQTLVEARKKMNANNQMKSKSFIAGYRNGIRIDLEEAIRLSKTN